MLDTSVRAGRRSTYPYGMACAIRLTEEPDPLMYSMFSMVLQESSTLGPYVHVTLGFPNLLHLSIENRHDLETCRVHSTIQVTCPNLKKFDMGWYPQRYKILTFPTLYTQNLFRFDLFGYTHLFVTWEDIIVANNSCDAIHHSRFAR